MDAYIYIYERRSIDDDDDDDDEKQENGILDSRT